MTLRSSASELGVVAGADENGIARGCGRAAAAARGRSRATPRWAPVEVEEEARRIRGAADAAARRAAAKRAMARGAAACEPC